uniref:Uncharacterized protein n=1 Tax=Lactuca sativa TaxID=4236 RepID=A0A9R1X543_LACSA|nr:hypothetical protein LSAT_V11C600327130 [Lactuca sativa]
MVEEAEGLSSSILVVIITSEMRNGESDEGRWSWVVNGRLLRSMEKDGEPRWFSCKKRVVDGGRKSSDSSSRVGMLVSSGEEGGGSGGAMVE